MSGHGDIRLGAKILNDDFQNVAVVFVERSNGEERVDALFHRFADTDEDAGSESETELSGFFDGAEAKRGDFVRRFGMRKAVAHQSRADVFEHQANAGI